MTSPLLELLLSVAAFLFIIGRYYVPPFVLAFALRDTNPQERAEIIREFNVFYRRKRGKEPSKQIPGDK